MADLLTLSILVASNLKGAIGWNNQLLWHLPDDLKRFKRLTMGKPMLMGRKTFESIGQPLPGRTSIVITRNTSFTHEGIIVCHSLTEAVRRAADSGAREAFVIGGGEIYQQAMSASTRIYQTLVHENSDGDTWFHGPDPNHWVEMSRCFHPADEKHAFEFEFIDWVRKS